MNQNQKNKRKAIGPADLNELYTLRDQMAKFGINTEPVEEKIAEAEYFLLAYATDQLAEIAPRKMDLATMKGKLTVAAEYENGRLVRVGAAKSSEDVFKMLDMYSIEIPE